MKHWRHRRRLYNRRSELAAATVGADRYGYAYDSIGKRIATTDALGNTTYRSYDPFGNVIAEDGATYPVRYTYDSQSRRTSLFTTRDGVTWDTTTWNYDHATGNCLSKTYADGSTVTYTYTPDSLPLRTTYASGRWKENVYDAKRQVVGVVYSDGESGSFAYDEFGNEVAASNEGVSDAQRRSARIDCRTMRLEVFRPPQGLLQKSRRRIDERMESDVTG